MEYLLGAPSDTGIQTTGILRYVIGKIRAFLSPRTVTEPIYTLRPDADYTLTSPNILKYPGEISQSFFFSSYRALNWLTQPVADSTLNTPPRYPASFIVARVPSTVCIQDVTLQTDILNLLSASSLECCFKTYINVHLNILESINVPTSITYFSPSLTLDPFNNIIAYNSLTITNIFEKLPASGTCPYSVIDLRYLKSTIRDCEYKNPNLKNIKYYIIAIINYMLFSISKKVIFDSLPPLDLTTITIPFSSYTVGNYVYGSTNGNTIQLLYNTYVWHQFLFGSFFGTGEFYDPINLPDATVCTSPTLTTTGLIVDFFYQEWKYNKCFLNYLSRLILTNLYDLLASTSIPLPPPPPIPVIPYERIANLERVTFINTQRPALKTLFT